MRRQLSLFVPAHLAAELEAVRRLLDPLQSRLIPAHVTLCREDELAQVPEDELRQRLVRAGSAPLTLQFGPPEVFSGHGLLVHCIAGEPEFQALRARLLGTSALRHQRPHLTLAHPRNPRAPGNSLANAARLPEALSFTFPTVSLIEQDGDRPWLLLRTFALPGGSP